MADIDKTKFLDFQYDLDKTEGLLYHKIVPKTVNVKDDEGNITQEQLYEITI